MTGLLGRQAFLGDNHLLMLSIDAVQVMSYVVADGKSNWLEGVILICEYHRQPFIVTSP